jgi:hypothetical protein
MKSSIPVVPTEDKVQVEKEGVRNTADTKGSV